MIGGRKIIIMYRGWRPQDLIEELAHVRQSVKAGLWGVGNPATALHLKWEKQIDQLFQFIGLVPE